MRILLTCLWVDKRSGSELYVAEVARALSARGHEVSILTTVAGELADGLRRDGIPVRRSLPVRGPAPDVIHAQGNLPTRAALARYPGVPALYVCHQHNNWRSLVRPHACIRRYAGVSQVCADALVAAGAPADQVTVLPNFVDLTLFQPRAALPDVPRRAVVFSNYTDLWDTSGLAEACRASGIALDIVGKAEGTATAVPHEVLPAYDIAFAKGRAALEALSVGCAVVLCDFTGVGPMVTSADYDRLRRANFGFATLNQPHSAEVVLAQLRRFDPSDAAAVSARLRAEAGLETYVDRLEDLYANLLADTQPCRISVSTRLLADGLHAADAAYMPLRRRLGRVRGRGPLGYRALRQSSGVVRRPQ